MRAGAGDGAGAGAAPHGRGARPGPASAPGARPGSCPRPRRSARAPLARAAPAPGLRSPSPHPARSTARPPERIHQRHEGLRRQSRRGRVSSSCPRRPPALPGAPARPLRGLEPSCSPVPPHRFMQPLCWDGPGESRLSSLQTDVQRAADTAVPFQVGCSK